MARSQSLAPMQILDIDPTLAALKLSITLPPSSAMIISPHESCINDTDGWATGVGSDFSL